MLDAVTLFRVAGSRGRSSAFIVNTHSHASQMLGRQIVGQRSPRTPLVADQYLRSGHVRSYSVLVAEMMKGSEGSLEADTRSFDATYALTVVGCRLLFCSILRQRPRKGKCLADLCG